MKFATRPTLRVKRAQAGFTLAEALAALAFMAIVIPVAIQGLHVAGLAGEVAARKAVAGRVAERVLSESIVTTNWSQSGQSGIVTERGLDFHWSLQQESWNEEPMQLLTVEVLYKAQGRDYSVKLSTLVDTSTPLTPTTMAQQ